eukprot:15348950-Ditylum_brightwellii.AAC.1
MLAVVKKVALVGFKDLAILIRSEDNVFAKIGNRTGTDKVRIRNTIILLPWIVKAIVKCNAGSFAEVYMVVLEAAKAKDTIKLVNSGNDSDGNQGEEGNQLKSIKTLLQYLYAWVQDALLWEATCCVVLNAANLVFDRSIKE